MGKAVQDTAEKSKGRGRKIVPPLGPRPVRRRRHLLRRFRKPLFRLGKSPLSLEIERPQKLGICRTAYVERNGRRAYRRRRLLRKLLQTRRKMDAALHKPRKGRTILYRGMGQNRRTIRSRISRTLKPPPYLPFAALLLDIRPRIAPDGRRTAHCMVLARRGGHRRPNPSPRILPALRRHTQNEARTRT